MNDLTVNKGKRVNSKPVSEGGKPWIGSYSPNFKENVPYTESTLYEMVKNAAEKFPEYTAYDFMGTTCSYTKLISQIDSTAAAFAALGVKPGDVITICLPNTPHSLLCFYAASKLGCISNMIHPLSPAKELKQYIEFGESDWLVTLDAFLPGQDEMLSGSRIKKTIVCAIPEYLPLLTGIGFMVTKGYKIKKIKNERYIQWKDFYKCGEEAEAACNRQYERPYNPADPAVYLHSGGTTGSPKTIMLSSNNFNILGLQGPGILNLKPEDIGNRSMLCILPMFHGFGLCMSIHTMLILGFNCILIPQFNAEVMANSIIKRRPNYIAGVPTLFESIIRNKKIMKTDLSCIKGAFCGGDSLPSETKRQFDAFIKEHGSDAELLEGYGLTETVTVCCVNQVSGGKTGTVGLPLGGMLMKIVKVDTFEEVPYGEDGEICVSGPTVMIGYLKDPESTAETVKTHPDGRKWVHTGDFGYMDTDGYIYYKQRLKRIIKCSGYPVFPSQVEDKIAEIPEVENVCVIGIPDDYQIERVKAYIVLKPGVSDTDSVTEKIKLHCYDSFAKWCVPTRWEYRSNLPRTNVGKIDYVALMNENK